MREFDVNCGHLLTPVLCLRGPNGNFGNIIILYINNMCSEAKLTADDSSVHDRLRITITLLSKFYFSKKDECAT